MARRASNYNAEDGRRRAEEVMKEQAAAREVAKATGSQPRNFFMRPGDTREIAIMDEVPNFFRWEHCTKDAHGRPTVYTSCIQEFDHCPRCDDDDKPSYYAMFLTILDFTEFPGRDGVTRTFSRKILRVKSQQQPKIFRLLDNHGSLRGMVLQMTRDGERSAAIGNDIEFVEFMDESELTGTEYINEWTDREGKKHTENCTEVIDYNTMYPEQTADDLAKFCKNYSGPAMGSSAANRQALDDQHQAAPATGRRRRGAATQPTATPARSAAPNRRTRAAPETSKADDPPPIEGEWEEEGQDTPWEDGPVEDAQVAEKTSAPATRRRRGAAAAPAPEEAAPTQQAGRRRRTRA